MILIVDDKPENIYSLKTLLEINKFRVDTALSGEEALKKILKNTYFLVILDVQMPGMDGFEVAEAISGYSKAKDLPIIFVSAVNTDKRFVTRGYTSGGIDYVTKPIDADLLLLKVKTFYRIYSQNTELMQVQRSLQAEIEQRKAAEQRLQHINQLLEERVAERTQKLLQTNAELEARNNELEQFGFITSHDLTEPLRKIQVFSHLVKKKFGDLSNGEALPYLDRIIASSDRLVDLIQDLLVYSRVSAAEINGFVNINSIITDVENDLELLIAEKQAVIEADPIPDLQVNPSQMRLVIQNLLSNAVKFSRQDVPPFVRISAKKINACSFNAPENEQGNWCLLTFTDNGIGFDEAYLDKIFVMFQRLHPREDYAGTGMGLAIVKKIIDKHQGIITARSTVGEGAVFSIVLPVIQNNNANILPAK